MLTWHILSLGFVIGVTAIADKEAVQWVSGKKETLEKNTLLTYHTLIWLGLLSLIVSGFILFWPQRLYLLGDFLFDIKLLFVGILVINAVLIGRLMDVALTKPFRSLTWNEKLPLFVSGAISMFSWCAAAAIAMWIF